VDTTTSITMAITAKRKVKGVGRHRRFAFVRSFDLIHLSLSFVVLGPRRADLDVCFVG